MKSLIGMRTIDGEAVAKLVLINECPFRLNKVNQRRISQFYRLY